VDDPDCVTRFSSRASPPTASCAGGSVRARSRRCSRDRRPAPGAGSRPGRRVRLRVKPGFPPNRGLYRFDPFPIRPGPENASPITYQASDVCLLGASSSSASARAHRARLRGDGSRDRPRPGDARRRHLTRGCASDGTDAYVVLAPASGPTRSCARREPRRDRAPAAAERPRRAADAPAGPRLRSAHGAVLRLFAAASEPNTATVTPFTMAGVGAPVTAPFALTNLGRTRRRHLRTPPLETGGTTRC